MSQEPKSDRFKEINQLMKRAQQGDEEVLPVIREILDAVPSLLAQTGDIASQAKQAWIKVAAGKNLVAQESIERKMGKLCEELEGPNPSLVERLLVERIMICWLQIQYADLIYAQNMGKISREWSDFYQQCQDRAHRRYLHAIATLARIRCLPLPTIQVNIGDKQVNLAGTSRLPKT